MSSLLFRVTHYQSNNRKDLWCSTFNNGQLQPPSIADPRCCLHETQGCVHWLSLQSLWTATNGHKLPIIIAQNNRHNRWITVAESGCYSEEREESSKCDSSGWVGVGWGRRGKAGFGCGHSRFHGVWWQWAQMNGNALLGSLVGRAGGRKWSPSASDHQWVRSGRIYLGQWSSFSSMFLSTECPLPVWFSSALMVPNTKTICWKLSAACYPASDFRVFISLSWPLLKRAALSDQSTFIDFGPLLPG